MSINNIKMLHKPPNQKLLLTNVNAILNKRSNSTIINELKPMRITKRYKTQSYNNLYDEIFKKKKNVKQDISVNNKYNLIYAENEKQFEVKLSKLNLTQLQRREKNSKVIANKLSGIKKDVLFLRRVVDYVYPTLLTKKVTVQTKRTETFLPLVTSYHEINRKLKEDNEHLKQYLYHSITISKSQ